MITALDNSQRVFLIERKGFSTRYFFCNLNQIPNIVCNELEPNDRYTIKHFWNSKFMRIGVKQLNEMFVANEIDFKFK